MPIPFDKIRFDNLEAILKILKDALSQLGVDFYLIGALARDIQLTGKHNIPTLRATRDIDMAILISDQDQYTALISVLTGRYGFEDTERPFRYRYEDGTLVDMMPFGAIESADRVVKLQGRRIEELSVIGLQENMDHTEVVEFDDGFHVKVCSLAGICLLKMFAWGEKPGIRERDINDISIIIDKYAEIYSDDIFDHHDDLLELNWESTLPPRLLGRHIGTILKGHDDTRDSLLKILNDNVSPESRLPELLARFNQKTIADNIMLVQQIITGVNE